MIKRRNPKHNVEAWYYAPIYPDNTDNTTRNKLEWEDNPVHFWCAFVKKTKYGFDILPNYVATGNDYTIETDSEVDFDDKGKIAFGRVEPKKEDASKITKDGIEYEPIKETNMLGSRFSNPIFRKRIKIG